MGRRDKDSYWLKKQYYSSLLSDWAALDGVARWCCKMHSVTQGGDMCWICTFFLDFAKLHQILKDDLCACFLFLVLLCQSVSSSVPACLFVCFPHLLSFLFVMPVILLLIISLIFMLLHHLCCSLFHRHPSLLCSCVSHLNSVHTMEIFSLYVIFPQITANLTWHSKPMIPPACSPCLFLPVNSILGRDQTP